MALRFPYVLTRDYYVQRNKRVPADQLMITHPDFTNNNLESNILRAGIDERPGRRWVLRQLGVGLGAGLCWRGLNMQGYVGRKLRRFIGEFFLLQEEPWSESEDASLRDSGIIINDIELIELIGFLEKTFGIVVLDEEIHPKNLDTIHALTTYVNRKLAQARANLASGKSWWGLRRSRTGLAAILSS